MTTYRVALDTDRDGTFDAAVDDITAFVLDVRIAAGFDNELVHTANIGQCFIEVDNTDRRFSPGYAAGPLYGLLLPYLPVRVQAVSGATTYTLFRGYAKRFEPDAGTLGSGRCRILVEDALSMFQRETIEIPPQVDCTADRLVKMIGADVFKTAACIDQLGMSQNPANGATFIFNSANYGAIVYTLRDTPAAANEIQIGADMTATAGNLIQAMNGDDDGLDTAYFAGTVPLRDMTAAGAAGSAYGGAGFGYTGTGGALRIANTTGAYQVLTITDTEAGTLSRIGWTLGANVGSPTGDIRVTLRNTPPTQALGAKDYIFDGTFTPSPSADELITLSDSILLAPGTWYLQIACVSDQTAGNYYRWVTGTGGGAASHYYDGAAWVDGAGDAKCTSVVGAVTPYLITLTAAARGTWANTITGSTTQLGWGTYLNTTPGADGPAGLLSIQTGNRPLSFAGATWVSGKTTGWTALDDVARSEFGYVWVARDGTLTFKNKDWEFTRFIATPALTIAGTHQAQDGALDERRILNAIEVTYVPGDQTSSGVVAQSATPIQVPGKSFTKAGQWPRNNRIEKGYAGTGQPSGAPVPGDKLIKLPFTDSDGNTIGARDIITPVAGTDYTVNDAQDASGFNYTLKKQIAVSVAPSASGVEVSFKNNAIGPLWVRGFQVRGTRIQHYTQETAVAEDATSINAYGKRPHRHDLVLESGAAFAESVAYYFLSRYAQPAYVVDEIIFQGPEVIGAANVLAAEIGDVVSLTESQAAITAHLYLVRSTAYQIRDGGQSLTVRLGLKRLDQQAYIIFDHATYGVFDSSAVFAL